MVSDNEGKKEKEVGYKENFDSYTERMNTAAKNIDKAAEKIEQAKDRIAKAEKEIEKLTSEGIKEEADKLDQTSEKVQKAADEFVETKDEVNQTTDNLNNNINNSPKPSETSKEDGDEKTPPIFKPEYAKGVVELTRTISQLTMAFSSLNSVFEIFEDKDLSGMEKIQKSIMPLMMALPMLQRGIEGLSPALKTVGTTINATIKAAGQGIEAMLTTLKGGIQAI